MHPFAFLDPAPVGWPLLLALTCVVVVYVILWRTPFGFELRAVGQSERAASANGIDVARIRIAAMTIAGALAGLVGVAEVLGNAHRFKVNFSPDYGFMGIAVALLARNNPFAIIPAALLFGALHKGAADLDLETEHVTRELSLVLQGIILLSVSAEGLWTWIKTRKASAPAKLTSGNVEGAAA
jgi:simple sugar transport system permease protein